MGFRSGGAVLAMLLLAACGQRSSSTPAAPDPARVVTSIFMNPGATTLQVGSQVLMEAVALDQFGVSMTAAIFWTVDDPSGAISSLPSGNYCHVDGIAVGVANLHAYNGSVSGDATVTVTPVPPEPVQVSDPATLPDGRETVAYAPVQFAATGGQGPQHWTVIVGTLPSGLFLTDQGLLAGTPASGSAGPHDITIQVADDLGTDSRAYTITIEPGIVFDPVPDPIGPPPVFDVTD